jgi:transcriptional regulator with XRE-family HTH domain
MKSYAEIAEEMGLSKSTVQRIEENAFRKIRKAVEERAAFAGLTPQEYIGSDILVRIDDSDPDPDKHFVQIYQFGE